MQHPIDIHPFRSMSIGPSIPEIQHFQNLTLKIQGQGQMTMMLHNYRSRQFHRTWNGINLSSGFRDMGSAKSGPSAASFDKFLAQGPGASPYGANGQITMAVHNYRSRQVHETLNGANPSSSFRDMRSAKSGPNLWQIALSLSHSTTNTEIHFKFLLSKNSTVWHFTEGLKNGWCKPLLSKLKPRLNF